MAKKSLSDLVKGAERKGTVGADTFYSAIMEGVRALETSPIKVSARLSGGASIQTVIPAGDIAVPPIEGLVNVEYVVTLPGQKKPLPIEYAAPLLSTLLEVQKQFSMYVQNGMDLLTPDALNSAITRKLETGGFTAEGRDYVHSHVSPILDAIGKKVGSLESARKKDRAVAERLAKKKSELETLQSQLQKRSEEAVRVGELLEGVVSAYHSLVSEAKCGDIKDPVLTGVLRAGLDKPYLATVALIKTVEGLGQTSGLDAQVRLLDEAIKMYTSPGGGNLARKYGGIPDEMQRVETGSLNSIMGAVRYVQGRLNGQSLTSIASALRRNPKQQTEYLMGQVQEANKTLAAYIAQVTAAVAASELVQRYEEAVKGGNAYEIMPLLQELGSNGNVQLKIKIDEKALRQAAKAVYQTLDGLYRDAISFPGELRQAAALLESCRNATRITQTGIDSLYRIAAADMARMNAPKP